MISSGMKRGLAATAISALAVTGIPALAGTANAVTNQGEFTNPDTVLMYSQDGVNLSAKNDGTNTTASLVAGGGANVTSVLYQYRTATTPVGSWLDVPGGPVSRNADGVFALDWTAPPADLLGIRAVANTGSIDPKLTVTNNGTSANTVELSTEGALGYFHSPYTVSPGDFVAAHGTASSATDPITVKDASDGSGASGSADITNDGDATTPETFSAVLDIASYNFSSGGDANQIALNAASSNSDDAEGSTLYRQTITSISATPASQDVQSGANAPVVITVLDQNQKPVANAQVGEWTDADNDGVVDAGESAILTPDAYTDGNGQIKIANASTGTHKYYANTTNTPTYEPGTDPVTTATVTRYTPSVQTVQISSKGSRTSYDLDEVADGDDFTITTLDNKGNKYDENISGNDVEFRWVIDPTAAGVATQTSKWLDETHVHDNGDGTYTVEGLTDADLADTDYFDTPPFGGELPVGSYTLEARRPNNGALGGLVNATPAAFNMGESEITFTDGADASAPIQGAYTVTGKLALVGDGTALGGRRVPLSYNGTSSGFAPQSEQPAGVTVTPASGGPGSTASVVTAADGTFSVKLKDQPVPSNVTPTPENATLTAGPAEESATDTTSLDGTNGPNDGPAADATGSIAIHWAAAPVVTDISIDTNTLDPFSPNSDSDTSTPAPGAPVDLDITVYQADGPDAGTDPDPVPDASVEISVDKGFLSPNAETANDATLAAGHDGTGDLWGFYKNDGATKTVSTGDTADAAGVVAAIEKDADFDDDGLATMTITVKSGGVTKTKTVQFDATNPINLPTGSLERAAGEPTGDAVVGDSVDFQLYTKDQFGNLVGEQLARVTDDSTVADVRTDGNFGDTESDFTTSQPGITATSNAPTTQTLTARLNTTQFTVSATDDVSGPSSKTLVIKSDPINWVAAPPVQHHIHPGISAHHVAATDSIAGYDKITVNAGTAGADAVVSLYRVKDGVAKKVKSKVLGTDGVAKFKRADLNGDKFNYYFAKVSETATNYKGRTDTIAVK